MYFISRICVLSALLACLSFSEGCTPRKGRPSYISLAGCSLDTVAGMVGALDQVPADSLTAGLRAWRGLCRVCLQDKSYADTLGPQSLIDSVMDYYEQAKSPYLATAYFYKARSLYYRNEYDASMPFYFKAERLAEKLDDYAMLARINMDIGEFNIYQQYHKKARLRFQRALQYYKLTREKQNIYALTGIGYSYMYDKEYDPIKALSYFYRALDLSCGDSAQMGIVLYEIGFVYYKINLIDSAKYYLRQSELICENNDEVQSRSLYLALIYCEEGKYDSACYYTDLGIDSTTNIYVKRACYDIKASIAEQVGDNEEADRCRRQILNCSDSIAKIERSQHEAYVYESEYHADQARVRTRNRWIAAVATGAALVFVFLLLAGMHWRRKKLQYEKNEKEGRQTESERNSLIAEQFETVGRRISVRMGDLQRQGLDYETSLRNAYNHILCLDNYPDFCRVVNRQFNNMATKLHVQYPQLDERDMKLCILHLLQTRNKDIAMLLYISINSVGNTKTRLAKKVGAGSATVLTRLLYDIFAGRCLN